MIASSFCARVNSSVFVSPISLYRKITIKVSSIFRKVQNIFLSGKKVNVMCFVLDVRKYDWCEHFCGMATTVLEVGLSSVARRLVL